MSKSLSFDAILAALAVLSVGCARADRATPAPEATNAPASAVPASIPVEPAPAASTAPTGETADTTATVDAGIERAKHAPAALPPPRQRKASASCGAGACSPDMKKNN
jgi:hypothetical protein